MKIMFICRKGASLQLCVGVVFSFRGDHEGCNDVCNQRFNDFKCVSSESIITQRMCVYAGVYMCVTQRDVVISESGC